MSVSTLDIKKIQMIHKMPQTGKLDAKLMSYMKGVQAKNGLTPSGVITAGTLNVYKKKWPYAWGLAPTSGSSGSSGSTGSSNFGSAVNPEPILDKVIGGVLLYGIFRVLMKVF